MFSFRISGGTSNSEQNQQDLIENMAALHSERNIRARIKEFEKQTSTGEVNTPTTQPRASRPVLAPKPSMTLSSSFSSTTEEVTNTFDTDRTPVPPSITPRPEMPRKLSVNFSDQLKPQPLIKPPPQHPSRPSLRRTRTLTSQEEDTVFNTPQLPPRTVHNSQQNFSNHSSTKENEYVEAPVSHLPSIPSRRPSSTNTMSRKPTIIRVPSKQEQESSESFPPALPVQRPGGGPSASIKRKDSSNSVSHQALPPRPGGGTMPPFRPPAPKPAPGRPPQPRRESILRNSTQQSQNSNRQSQNTMWKKTPVLPPRPKPGHLLYNKYSLEIPYLAEYDDNDTHTRELYFQESTSHQASTDSVEKGTLQVQALYDFSPEGPGELGLNAGDIINNVEQIDSEWYLGTSRGITGFFPINYTKPLSREPASAPARVPAPAPKPAPATLQKVSGPRCRARFDFEAEQSDELSFNEGQVIRLLEYMGEEWARGEVSNNVGIFPLNFVEVLEDLPASPAKNQFRVPLPGMAATNNVQAAAAPTHSQACGVERVKALYDFTAEKDGDLSFLRGDVIEVIEHFNEDWSQGSLNGQEGLFPRSFTQIHTGGSSYR